MVDADGASKFSDLDKLEKAMNEEEVYPSVCLQDNNYCILMQNDEEGKMIVAVGSRAHMEEESVVQVKRRQKFSRP